MKTQFNILFTFLFTLNIISIVWSSYSLLDYAQPMSIIPLSIYYKTPLQDPVLLLPNHNNELIVNIMDSFFNTFVQIFKPLAVQGHLDDLIGQQIIIQIILFVLIISLILLFIFHIINSIFLYNKEYLLKKVENRFVRFYLKYQTFLAKLSLFYLPVFILFGLVVLSHGLYFLIQHQIPYEQLDIDLHQYIDSTTPITTNILIESNVDYSSSNVDASLIGMGLFKKFVKNPGLQFFFVVGFLSFFVKNYLPMIPENITTVHILQFSLVWVLLFVLYSITMLYVANSITVLRKEGKIPELKVPKYLPTFIKEHLQIINVTVHENKQKAVETQIRVVLMFVLLLLLIIVMFSILNSWTGVLNSNSNSLEISVSKVSETLKTFNNVQTNFPPTNQILNTVVAYLKPILEPVSVEYSNEVLAKQIYGISILLFIMSIMIIILLLAFIINITILVYSDKLMSLFTNKYIIWYISINKRLIGIEILFLGASLLYFMYNLSSGIHFIAIHPIRFNS